MGQGCASGWCGRTEGAGHPLSRGRLPGPTRPSCGHQRGQASPKAWLSWGGRAAWSPNLGAMLVLGGPVVLSWAPQFPHSVRAGHEGFTWTRYCSRRPRQKQHQGALWGQFSKGATRPTQCPLLGTAGSPAPEAGPALCLTALTPTCPSLARGEWTVASSTVSLTW